MKTDFYYQYKEQLKEDLFSLLFNQESFPRTDLVLPTIFEFAVDCTEYGVTASYKWDSTYMILSVYGRRIRIHIINDCIYVNYKEFSFLGFINFIMDALK